MNVSRFSTIILDMAVLANRLLMLAFR